ncbi:MAG: serine/threonine-protein kinase, partial [Pseudoxanthomonas sp.]|nr:serine/threonine-protein kinase [Pseudoxanthomonas sp.]
MSPGGDPARVLDLLAEALTVPAGERAACLDRLAGGDAALRRELESLLAADDRAAGFLEPQPAVDRAGERVGAWRLASLLGRGGMGEVWLARRDDGLYQSQVAIKFLRPGLAAEADRFARERRLLAGLAHPNIARVVDAGHDDRGVPWVAMDYVDGQPLDLWCRSRSVSPRGRVQLLLKVVEAVAFAHARLVVHRDLKPANILVDEGGEPHLLDFGIAKLLDEAEPGLTVAGVAPMTPDYASPEQL